MLRFLFNLLLILKHFVYLHRLRILINIIMENLNFEDSTKCFLVFEGGFHHSIYFDLINCIYHYNWLLNFRKDDAVFTIFELVYDSDMQSFTPNGLLCTLHKGNKIICRYKCDYENLKSYLPNFDISLQEYKPISTYHE